MDLDAQQRPLVMPLEVACVPVLADNYVWLAHEPASGATVAIDPGEADPVLAEAERRGWRIDQVWITHWHGDHVGGLAEVKAATGARVTGPRDEADRIVGLDVLVGEGDTVALGNEAGRVLAVPGHTAGHVAFLLDHAGVAFVGDTLFAMGCGRLFEGGPAEMWCNMQRYAALPPETLVYGGHEYTEANLRFAQATEPGNPALAERAVAVAADRAAGRPTLPTTIALERATNPFLRAGSVEEFARRRQAKDLFR
jgi:hydroxyacylglutathione hydrolase